VKCVQRHTVVGKGTDPPSIFEHLPSHQPHGVALSDLDGWLFVFSLGGDFHFPFMYLPMESGS